MALNYKTIQNCITCLNETRPLTTKEIFALNKLKHLDLHDKLLTYQIRTNIKYCVKLESLDLSKTNLGEIPDEIFLLTSLEELNLSHNHIKIIPDSINKLSNLKKLYLSHNEITKIPALCNLKKLDILLLDDNPCLMITKQCSI
jgi:Leucine-rich repeat (LRR) protein